MSQLTLKDGIKLVTGERFDYRYPEQANVSIQDIAVPLSNICRYAGQLRHPDGSPFFYSVAQHLVNTSYIVPEEHAYSALLHDTAEATTNDLPTPLKAAVPAFKELEINIEMAMAEKFGFMMPMHPLVALADRQMLGLEMKYIRNEDTSVHAILNGIEFDHLLPLVDLTSWTPRLAWQNFMRRYEELRPR